MTKAEFLLDFLKGADAIDVGLGYFITLTEGGINEGSWEEGVFSCQDSKGDPTQLTSYKMHRIVPTHPLGD